MRLCINVDASFPNAYDEIEGYQYLPNGGKNGGEKINFLGKV